MASERAVVGQVLGQLPDFFGDRFLPGHKDGQEETQQPRLTGVF